MTTNKRTEKVVPFPSKRTADNQDYTVTEITLNFTTPEGCKAWREHKGISLEEFSESAGYTVGALTLFEAGQMIGEATLPIRMAYRMHSFWNYEYEVAQELVRRCSGIIKRSDPDWGRYLEMQYLDIFEDDPTQSEYVEESKQHEARLARIKELHEKGLAGIELTEAEKEESSEALYQSLLFLQRQLDGFKAQIRANEENARRIKEIEARLDEADFHQVTNDVLQMKMMQFIDAHGLSEEFKEFIDKECKEEPESLQ